MTFYSRVSLTDFYNFWSLYYHKDVELEEVQVRVMQNIMGAIKVAMLKGGKKETHIFHLKAKVSNLMRDMQL